MIRSLRKSFRKKKQPRVPESTRPHQWQKDEEEVRASKCNFHVKVLYARFAKVFGSLAY